MDARRLVPFGVLIALALLSAIPAASQNGDQIIVSNADEVRTTSVSVDQGLLDRIGLVLPRITLQYANELRSDPLSDVPSVLRALLDGVPPRVIVQYGNTVRHVPLDDIPGAMRTALGHVAERVVVQYANTLRHEPLAPGPPPLQTVLAQMGARVVIQYANENRHFALAYPGALLGDSTPPQITHIQAIMVSDDAMIVRWATDEYADSEVDYGAASGVYTGLATDPLYTKQHELTISGLPPDTAIYFRVRSTDQSGNTAQSAEQAHAAEEEVYLPAVLRDY